MHRRWSILLVLLVATTALAAGCTKKDDGGDGGGGDGNTTPTGTTPTSPTGGTGGNSTPQPRPTTQPVTDQGGIQGQFSKSWTLTVPQVSPKLVTVLFNLTGAQPGAPPTALVHLQFAGPDGTVLKSADVGLGASGGNAVAWTFGPADLGATGDYVVSATAAAPAPGAPGLPSGGVGNFQFYGHVEY